LTTSQHATPTRENRLYDSQQEPGVRERRKSEDGAVQGAAVTGYRVATGGEAVFEGLADLLVQQRNALGAARWVGN